MLTPFERSSDPRRVLFKFNLVLILMRKSALFILYFVFVASLSSIAQKNEDETRKGQLGITFSSFGPNDVVRSQELIGSASKIGEEFFTFGIDYLSKLNSFLDVETGIEYSNHRIIIDPMLSSGMNLPSYGGKFSLISIPATVRVNFARYFFVNGGIFLGIDATNPMPVDSQTGIGANLGMGVKYKFKCGATAFVNPYLKAHSLVPFSSGQYQQHLMESGLRFGLMYKLN